MLAPQKKIDDQRSIKTCQLHVAWEPKTQIIADMAVSEELCFKHLKCVLNANICNWMRKKEAQ